MSTHAAVTTTGRFNRIVVAILTSRFHRLLSRWFCVIDYTGRRSGHRYVTPTQYARSGGRIVILVGRSDTKTWWRNFTGTGHPLNIVINGTTVSTNARAVVGNEQPADTENVLSVFIRRYPRAAKTLDGKTLTEQANGAVLVEALIAEPDTTHT